MKRALVLLTPLFLALACVQPATVSTPSSSAVQTPCEMDAAAETLSDPQNIQELTSFINALPKPLNQDCLLKSLKRPLYVNATSSTSSAQPADGVHNPRIFIFKGDLIISVVPQGAGAAVLEFSELLSSTRSIKGELNLPINSQIAEKAPFVKINNGNVTTCSACHGSEMTEYMVDETQVYSSVAIKPPASMDVDLYALKYELYLCQFNKSTASRCKVLDALLSQGDIYQATFPAGMRTFLQ